MTYTTDNRVIPLVTSGDRFCRVSKPWPLGPEGQGHVGQSRIRNMPAASNRLAKLKEPDQRDQKFADVVESAEQAAVLVLAE